MKNLLRFVLLSAVLFSLCSTISAVPVKLTSGEFFIGGSTFGTPGYQNYMRFYFVGKTRSPQRSYVMQAEQIDAVNQNHPAQPDGDYEYIIRMPNHGSSLAINDNIYFPVWYACNWVIESSAQTPIVTVGSPQFIIVNAPFQMSGSSNFSGAFSTGFRLRGRGVSELKFEKINSKYFIREARYTLTDTSTPNILQNERLIP